MSVLGMNGFEAQNVTRDRLTVVFGTPSYQTGVPTGSKSLRSMRLGTSTQIRAPWYALNQTSQEEPSGTEYWIHGQVKLNQSNTLNDTIHFGVNRNGTETISVSFQDTTNKLTIRINGTVTDTAATAAASVGVFKRIHVHVDQQTGGLVQVYVDGNLSTAVVSHTLTSGEITAMAGKPNEFRARGPDSGTCDFDDFFAIDPSDATGLTNINLTLEASIEPVVPSADGNYTAWTGTFADVDELPASDVDSISTTTVDTAETFGHAAIDEDRVLAVKTYARVTRTDTSAGSNMEIRLRRTDTSTDADSGTFAAPGDGDVSVIHDVAPGAATWTPAIYDVTEFGVVART